MLRAYGKSSSFCWLQLTATVAASRSIVGAVLVTVTSSATVATSRFPLTVRVVFAATGMPSMFSVLKPARANVTRYVPGTSSVNRYVPCSSVTALRVPPIIVGLVIVTSTPGIRAPLVSDARAVMAPLVCVCENAGAAANSSPRHSPTISRNSLCLIHFLRIVCSTPWGDSSLNLTKKYYGSELSLWRGLYRRNYACCKGIQRTAILSAPSNCRFEVHLGSDRLARRLGLFDATMLVMGGIVGSGIFMNPYVVARVVHTPVLILGAWIFGGIVALIGAFIYGELAARRPQVGGQYAYIREAFNPIVAFIYGWGLLLVTQTGGMAAVAVTFARYFIELTGSHLPDALIAASALAALTIINCRVL